MDKGGLLRSSKGLKHCQNAFQTSYKVKRVYKVAMLIKRRKHKDDVMKMKIGFWIEQCTHALFECPEDVNIITKNHTKAVSGEF